MSRVIYITGHSGVGKGTVAELIQEELHRLGYITLREAFASQLKILATFAVKDCLVHLNPDGQPSHAAAQLQGMREVSYASLRKLLDDDPTLKEQVFRPILQGLGEGMRRLVDRDVWLNMLIASIRPEVVGDAVVIIDDCRYPNEAMHAMNSGGLLIGVTGWNRRQHISHIAPLGRPMYDTNHSSVTGVITCLEAAQILVGNNGNMAQLREAVRLQVFSHPQWKFWLERIGHAEDKTTGQSSDIRAASTQTPSSLRTEPESASETNGD